MEKRNIASFNDFFNSMNEKQGNNVINQLKDKNPEHPFLKAFRTEEEIKEIKTLWDEKNYDDASRLFRSKLNKLNNKKLATALLLMISGTALGAAGYDALHANVAHTADKMPVIQPPATGDEMYIIKKGDTIWDIARHHLPSGANDADIMNYTRQIATDNGMNQDLIDAVLTKVPGDPDLIFPGGKLLIKAFAK